MPAEATSVSAILRLLRRHGHAIKTHGSAFGHAGTPDVLGCVRGRMIAVEVKRPGQAATPLQAAELRKWEAAGAVALVATSVQQVEDALRAARLVP